MTTPNPGDLIFVKPRPDDRIGQFVASVTHGDYCHVRLALGQGFVIEADTQGVSCYFSEVDPEYEDVAPTGTNLLHDYQQHASDWAMRQRGRKYSWWDIAADGMKLLLPRWMGSRTPFLVAPHQFDCSSFTTQFLLFAGYQWLPDDIAMDPMRVSPNDLARAVGLLK